MGGHADQISAALEERYRDGMPQAEAVRLAVELHGSDPAGGEARQLTPEQLEVAVLDRNRPRRKFRRLTGSVLAGLLAGEEGAEAGEERPSPPTSLAGCAHEPPEPPAPTGPTPPPPTGPTPPSD
jgi:proteasome alpha subunit